MRRISIYTLLVSIILLSLYSCSISHLDILEVREGLPANLKLDINVGEGHKIETRGVYDYESDIDNLVLFMFEKHGRVMVIDLTGKIDINSGVTSGTLGSKKVYSLTEPITLDARGDRILSGEYKVYAIANYDSPFFSQVGLSVSVASLLQDYKNGKDITEDQLMQMMSCNPGPYISVSKSEALPMSYITNNFIIICDDDQSTSSVQSTNALTLRRIVSHIYIDFIDGVTMKNGQPNPENPSFIPREISLYNLPKTCYAFDARQQSILRNTNKLTQVEGEETNYGNLIQIPIDGASADFEFYMLESVFDNVPGCTDYHKRDAWTNGVSVNVTLPSEKSFTYAPKNSTFFVVQGDYQGRDYVGDVSYTIHLGNFSKSPGNNPGNFTVNRNEYHSYIITIYGANNVIAESDVEGGGAQPGQEGVIVSTTDRASRFVLDSHYETVLVKFKKPTYKEITDAIILSTSPIEASGETMFRTYDELKTSPIPLNPTDVAPDINWIHFMSPEYGKAVGSFDKTSFPAYKAEGTCSLLGLIDELAITDPQYDGPPINLISDPHYVLRNEGGVNWVYTVAFVDEYFYEKLPGHEAEGYDVPESDVPWSAFVNKENRVLAVVMGNQASLDGNSKSYTNFLFHISQRSIKTTYPVWYENEYMRTFGIETWNETGYATDNYNVPNSGTNGWENTWNNVTKSWPDRSKLGYLESITSNTKENHKYASASGTMDAINACLSRNRDENGNGTLEANELKWYLPSVVQYFTIWLGNDQLFGDTQLFDPKDYNKVNTTDSYNYFCLYSSSGYDNKYYWPIEGASSGNGDATSGKVGVRCVRNLYVNKKNKAVSPFGKQYPDDLPTDSNSGSRYNTAATQVPYIRRNPVKPEDEEYYFKVEEAFKNTGHQDHEYLIEVIGASMVRTNEMVGGYAPGHNERSVSNRAPMSFRVAESVLSGEYSINDLRGDVDVCTSNYYERADKSDLGRWRVPNQMELMIMAMVDKAYYSGNRYFAGAKDSGGNLLSYKRYASKTFSSFYQKDGLGREFKTQPYYVGTGGKIKLGANISPQNIFTNFDSKLYIIRCVRDARTKQQRPGAS